MKEEDAETCPRRTDSPQQTDGKVDGCKVNSGKAMWHTQVDEVILANDLHISRRAHLNKFKLIRSTRGRVYPKGRSEFIKS